MKRARASFPRFAARAAVAIAVAAVAASPGRLPSARADEASPDAAKSAQTVTRLNAEGTSFFKAREFRRALERFNEAYALEAEPDLLYNIARCHEALGESSAAIDKYTRYLEQPGADAEGRARAEEKLRSLRQAQAGRAGPGGAAAAPATRPPAGAAAPEGRSFSPWTWVALGLGGAAAAGGTIAFLAGKSDHDKVTGAENYDRADQNDRPSSLTRARARELVDSGDTKKAVGVALWGAGGAALVTSAVLFALERPKAAERAAAFDFAPGPGGGLLSLHGRF